MREVWAAHICRLSSIEDSSGRALSLIGDDGRVTSVRLLLTMMKSEIWPSRARRLEGWGQGPTGQKLSEPTVLL